MHVRARRREIAPALAIMAMMLSTAGLAFAKTNTTPSAATTAAAAPRQVLVGVYVVDIGDFDLSTGSFNADFYLWFRWQGLWTAVPSLNQTGPFPSRFELIDGQITNSTLEESDRNESGSGYNYLFYRVQAAFNVPLNLMNFPLDVQTLSIELEDQLNNNNTLVYVADPQSQLGPGVTVPGWIINKVGTGANVTNYFYNTSFGFPPPNNSTSSYSRYEFDISIRRPFTQTITELLLPIATITALAVVAFFIKYERFEERLALLVTAVLAAVVLQVDFSASVPSGSFTLADEMMGVVYGVLFYGLGVSVIQQVFNNEKHEHLLDNLNRVSLIVIPVVTLVAMAAIILPVCATRACVVPGL